MSAARERPRPNLQRSGTRRSRDAGAGLPHSGDRPSGELRSGRGSTRRGGRPDLGGDQVEGIQAVRELLRAARREVFEIIVDRDGQSAALSEIAATARSCGIGVRSVDDSEIRRRAASEVPQGVIAFAQRIEPVPLRALLQGDGVAPFLIVLDGITDPGNLGALLRTALGAGATGVVLPRHDAVRLTPSAVKAAAGAIEHLPIALASGVPSVLRSLHDEGVWSVGLDESGAVDIDAVALFDQPIALVLGAEGRGLAPLTRARCDVIARIELFGPLGSLNVAAAGAVACFAVARSRRAVSAGG